MKLSNPSCHTWLQICMKVSPRWFFIYIDVCVLNHRLDTTQVPSPRSVISRIDHDHTREKAERVLEMLVSILSDSRECFMRFAAALPLTRICLLLIGHRSSSTVATEILKLLDISLNTSRSFSRKFELVSGWTILKSVLPYAWDSNVHAVAFRILLGGQGSRAQSPGGVPVVVCPNIMPAILASLNKELQTIACSIAFRPGGNQENGYCA